MPRPLGPFHLRGTLALALTVVLLAGCGPPGRDDHGRVSVVATTTQLADFARAIGGDRVRVHAILRPNSDPHEYEPRPHDVLAVARARVTLISGDGLDEWMNQVSSAAGARTPIDVGSRIPFPLVRRGDSRPDPHWWHDPRNVERAALVIRDAFVRADPAGAPSYRRAAAAYELRVRALDAAITRCVAQIPADQRKLVTNHDALDYFARRYGLEVVGTVIPAQASEAQPSAGALARLAKLVRRERVAAIFPERAVNGQVARALAGESGARADISLYGDTLGPAGSSGATYLRMEAANADALVRGLSGDRHRCPSLAAPRPSAMA